MTDPTEDRMGGVAGVPTARRPLSVSERAVFLELAELGVRPEAAALMARRQPVRPDVVRGLRLKQAFDGHQAGNDAHDRWIRESNGPGAPDATGATPEFGKVSSLDVDRAAGTVAAAALAASAQAAGQLDAAADTVPETAEVTELDAQPAQPQVKPVVVAGGAYAGGAEDFGGPALVLKVPMGEYLDGKVVDHQLAPGSAVGSAVPSAPVAATAPPAPTAAATTAPGGATSVALPDQARSSALARKQAVASDMALGTAIDVGAVALGVVSPPLGVAMYVARRVAARLDGIGGL